MYGQMTAGELDLHRHAGDPAGDLRDPRRRAPPALRWRAQAGGSSHRRGSVDGRRAATGHHDERGWSLSCEVEPRADRAAALDTANWTRGPTHLDQALYLAGQRDGKGSRFPSACWGTPRTFCRRSCAAGSFPDVVTDQTSAHDELNGYVPARDRRRRRRRRCARRTRRATSHRSYRPWRGSVEAMIELHATRARSSSTTATTSAARRDTAGLEDAFAYPGFVPAYIRPMFCRGEGTVPLGGPFGRPGRTSTGPTGLILELFPENERSPLDPAGRRTKVTFQGLRARICWLGYGERAKAGPCVQ